MTVLGCRRGWKGSLAFILLARCLNLRVSISKGGWVSRCRFSWQCAMALSLYRHNIGATGRLKPWQQAHGNAVQLVGLVMLKYACHLHMQIRQAAQSLCSPSDRYRSVRGEVSGFLSSPRLGVLSRKPG